jgi:hypothetical protein
MIMTEQTQQSSAEAGAVPARIQLDDFIEAVSRGVTRALEAQDDVSGYVISQPGGPRPVLGGGPIVIGIYFPTKPGDGAGGGSSPPIFREPPIVERR